MNQQQQQQQQKEEKRIDSSPTRRTRRTNQQQQQPQQPQQPQQQHVNSTTFDHSVKNILQNANELKKEIATLRGKLDQFTLSNNRIMIHH